jgi:transposase-like protein
VQTKEKKMTQQINSSKLHPAVEALLKSGFDGMAECMRIALNEAMVIERGEALKASPYERSEERKGYANGFKNKTVQTRTGSIDLNVPQVRGDISFYPSAIEKGLRSERAINLAICQMYIQGVSTRKVDPIMKMLCGVEVSREKVSKISQEMDEELQRWRDRKLDWVKYMIVDARYEKVRVDGIVRDCAVLVAHGIQGDDGKRSVLGVSVSLSEAECHWRDFFRSLKERGLHGLQMITSDAHAGLKAALRTEFGGVPWQRCQFHLQQNAQAHISKVALKKPVAQDIRNIFNAPDLEEAKRLLAQAINKYKVDSHELADWMQDNIEQSFTCFAMPEAHRKRLRTSNMAEVINRELKRRTRIIGIFPNEESLLRISSALLKEVDERWIEGRTYLNMEQ